MFGIYAHAHPRAHSYTLHGCLDHTHLSFHPLNSIPRPTNVLVILTECTSGEFTSCSLVSVRSAQVLSERTLHIVRTYVFSLANGGDGCNQVCFTAVSARCWVVILFLSRSSNRKMFCAQHIWESKQMFKKNHSHLSLVFSLFSFEDFSGRHPLKK